MGRRLHFLFLLCLLAASVVTKAQAPCATGQLSTSAQLRFNTLFVCSDDGLADEVAFQFNFDVTTQSAVLLVDQSFRLLRSSTSRIVDLEGLPPGRAFAVGVTYTGDLLIQAGQNIFSSPLASGCSRLTQNNIAIQAEAPQAGTLALSAGGTNTLLCLEDNVADFVGFRRLGANDFGGYVYLITDEQGRIEAITGQGFRNFQYDGAGTSRVYGLAFNRNLQARPGQSIFFDQLAEGCYALTDNYLSIEREVVDGGRISVNGRERVTIDSASGPMLSVDRVSTSSADVAYVLIDRQSTILSLSPGPTIDFTCVEPGSYLLYAYSFTGQITVAPGDRLWNTSNRFASGCFLASENAIVIEKTSVPNCQPSCLAEAGTLTANRDTLDLVNGIVTLQAVAAGNAVVPNDYETLYLLTQGDIQTIVAASFTDPSFVVTTSGDYTINTLVAELDDPSNTEYVDLAQVNIGTTTLSELQGLLDLDAVCADLDASGQSFYVTVPAQGPCTAFAGGAISVNDPVALVNGEATIAAMPDGAAAVPANFELKYVLTTGFLYTILEVSEQPSFTVTEAGSYTIHPVVLESTNPASPDFVDLTAIVLGTTSALDFILDAFDAGKCIDFDFFGAAVTVTGGQSCQATAGTTTALADTVSLTAGGSVLIEATSDGNSVIPVGFERTYVLVDQQGIAQAIGARPRFQVDSPGDYRIHEWVGEFDDQGSTDYIDVNAIALGLATLQDIIDLLDGSGKCGEVEPAGTPITVLLTIPSRPLLAAVTPTAHGLQVHLTEPTQPVTVMLSDLSGRTLWQQSVPAGTMSFEVTRTQLPQHVAGQALVVSIVGPKGLESKLTTMPRR